MLDSEREDDRPEPWESDAQVAVREPEHMELIEEPGLVEAADPPAVEARPTPLPSVDGALLGLTVQVLTHPRQPARRGSIAPPPAPPGVHSDEAASEPEPGRDAGYNFFDGDDSSVSLMEMIDGVPRPLGSTPLPSSRVPAYVESPPRSSNRLLTWVGIATGIVQCTILALAFSEPAEPKPAGIVVRSAGVSVTPAEAPLAPLAPAPAAALEAPRLEAVSPATVDYARAASPRLERASHKQSRRQRLGLSKRLQRTKKQRRLRAMRRSVSTRGSHA